MADFEKAYNAYKNCSDPKFDCNKCIYLNNCKQLDADILELLKSQQAEIDKLKQEKADAIERIKRMAEEIPYTPAKTETDGIYLSGKYWGMKDSLDILKGKDGEQE